MSLLSFPKSTLLLTSEMTALDASCVKKPY
jgi:hypothetical protein